MLKLGAGDGARVAYLGCRDWAHKSYIELGNLGGKSEYAAKLRRLAGRLGFPTEYVESIQNTLRVSNDK